MQQIFLEIMEKEEITADIDYFDINAVKQSLFERKFFRKFCNFVPSAEVEVLSFHRKTRYFLSSRPIKPNTVPLFRSTN